MLMDMAWLAPFVPFLVACVLYIIGEDVWVNGPRNLGESLFLFLSIMVIPGLVVLFFVMLLYLAILPE